MTFYNIIFGILFLGAIREVFSALTLPWAQASLLFWEATTLALIIFSDVVYTSHVLEELKKPYDIRMKLIDLVNFLILTLALLVLDPSANNMFQFSVESAIGKVFGAPPPKWGFWMLLLAYWLLLSLWVRVGRVHPGKEEFDGLTDGSSPGVSPGLKYSWIKNSLWFLIRWGRILGLIILMLTLITAYWQPQLLAWISPVVCFLSVVYLVLSGYILNLYKSIPDSLDLPPTSSSK